ncbi:hypothetical protein WOLCODRAFT_137081 [Wolfiporia cocos MD-104 SS10]|uniref:Uncharacterized protein n=1 Tax=Wolfiporia cocos (strain MD-104) TaxID=742152 RepID=A0A2H3JGA0_WOLCO|nr:hypothetical protein WOLCODRAFT_137081 [Wolfiporia cocos MD-104 SS10]
MKFEDDLALSVGTEAIQRLRYLDLQELMAVHPTLLDFNVGLSSRRAYTAVNLCHKQQGVAIR